MHELPEYPLTVTFSDGDIEVVQDETDACCNLEWLDTDDRKDPTTVIDAKGRRTRLRIVALQIEVCELET